MAEKGDEINWITYRQAWIKCILTKGTGQVDIDAGIKPLIHTKAISYRKVRHPSFWATRGLSYSPFKKSRWILFREAVAVFCAKKKRIV